MINGGTFILVLEDFLTNRSCQYGYQNDLLSAGQWAPITTKLKCLFLRDIRSAQSSSKIALERETESNIPTPRVDCTRAKFKPMRELSISV